MVLRAELERLRLKLLIVAAESAAYALGMADSMPAGAWSFRLGELLPSCL